MRRLTAIVGAVALAAALSIPASAAPDRGEPSCVISPAPPVLTAIGLPVGEPIRVSDSIYPGQGEYITDGTLTLTLSLTPPFTIYIHQRGGGKSLVKMPPGYGDYHVIAICSA